jgi:hypothetical protein
MFCFFLFFCFFENGPSVSHDVCTLHCSWGYTSPNVFDQSVLDAIDYAVNEKDVLVVFAAGNSNDDGKWYPAVHPNVIAVAATDDEGIKATFSNYGGWVDIAAPGSPVLSTSINDQYVEMSGTSMACPHVSGVLALGKTLKPEATADELKACLVSTTNKIDSLNPGFEGNLGAGMMDAEAFLLCVKGQSETPCDENCGNCKGALGEPGCSCDTCQNKICSADPYCCEVSWDGICATAAQESCECGKDTSSPTSSPTASPTRAPTANPTGNPATCDENCGNCKGALGEPGCSCDTCQNKICSADPYCCEVSWDGIWATAAQEACECPTFEFAH